MENYKRPNIVVFDLDETIGYFTEFSVLYDIFIKYGNIPHHQQQHVFNILFDLYPEYLRPDILNILIYLANHKRNKKCAGVYIYTNNQAPIEWTYLIKTYLENKIGYPLFNHVVGAFKIKGRVQEVCRCSHDKTRRDLIRCAKLPTNSHICFIDNTHYESMHDVFYIKVNTYTYNLSFPTIINRLLASNIGKQIHNHRHFINYVKRYNPMSLYVFQEKDPEEYELDVIVSKKIVDFLKTFFDEK